MTTDTGSSILAATRSIARYLTHTTGSMLADAATVAARAGELLGDAVTGRTASPATLRVSCLILSDERGEPLLTPDQLTPALERADAIWQAGAGIRIRHLSTRVVGEPAPTAALDPRANKLLLLDEVIGRNEFYHRGLRLNPDSGTALEAVGRPITVIVVRDIAGNTTGCSLGISADWVVVQASLFRSAATAQYDETVLAHELGHALNLPHHPATDNLMYFSSSPPDHLRGTALNAVQRAVVNANRHVIPGVRS